MRLLLFSELKTLKGIPHSRVHISRQVRAGKFPAPITIGDRSVAWIEEEVDDLIAERAALREKTAT